MSLTPRQVIESIRRDYFVGEELEQSIASRISKAQARENRMLKILSEDLYSKKTHFALELIQNADDNSFDPQTTPAIRFQLEPNRVIVHNNELGFSEQNVRALCDVGNSTKKGQSGFIGEKGIGFKSVFTISDSPEIHSAGYHFRFSVGGKDQHLGYVVPHWIDSSASDLPSNGTSLVLPAKKGERCQESLLAGVEKELLLFLRRLREIEISIWETDRIARFSRADKGQVVVIERKATDGKHENTERFNYVISRHSVDLAHAADERRKGIGQSEMVLAFPVDDDRKPAPDVHCKTFAFLPIREYGFRFIIQADFLLISDREDIHTEPAWNCALRDAIPDAFMVAVEQFKKSDRLRAAFYNYLPRENEISGDFFEPAREAIFSRLRSEKSILTVSGKWVKPQDALLASEGCGQLISNAELRKLIGKEYVSGEVVADDDLLWELGCETFNIDHLLECLSNEQWVKGRNHEWLARLYAFFAENAPSASQTRALAALKVFPLEDGRLTTLTDGVVYLPLSRTQQYGFEAKLSVLAADVIPKSRNERQAVLDFLDDLGIKEPSPTEIIDGHILPAHKSDAWQEFDDAALIGHIAYIREHLDEYIEVKCRDAKGYEAEMRRERILAALNETLWIKLDDGPDGNTYEHASSLYLDEAYGNPHPIRLIFKDSKDCSFLSRVYLDFGAERVKDKAGQAKAWANFFGLIGGRFGPRVNSEQGNGSGNLRPKSLPNTSRGYSFSDWVPSPELATAMRSKDSKVRLALINLFDRQWGQYYAEKLIGTVSGTYYNRSNSVEAYSTFRSAIREMLAPVMGGPDCPLGETFLDKKEIREIFPDARFLALKLTNEKFLEAAGVRFKVDASTAVGQLRAWREGKPVSVDVVRRMYRLIQALSSGDGQVELKKLFASEPLIFVPGGKTNWVASGDVCWYSYGRALRDYILSLEADYPEFREFFVDLLGVAERLSSEQLVEVLEKIKDGEPSAADARESALRIYQELESNLRRLEERGEEAEESPWSAKLRDGLLWTNKDDFWVDEGDVFVNDLPDRAALFSDNPRLAFIGMEPSAVPKLRRFIARCGLRLLTTSIEQDFPDDAALDRHASFSDLVQRRWLQIARYLYARDYSQFDELAESGRLHRLRQLPVLVAKRLSVTVRLNNEEASADLRALALADKIIIDGASSDDVDCLAVELSRWLSALDEAGFISLLLIQKGDAEVDRLLRNHNIPELPTEELTRLTTALGLPAKAVVTPQEVVPLSGSQLPLADTAGPIAVPEIQGTPGPNVSRPEASGANSNPSAAPSIPSTSREKPKAKVPSVSPVAKKPDVAPPESADAVNPPTAELGKVSPLGGTPNESLSEGLISERRQKPQDSEGSPTQSRRDRVPVYVSRDGDPPETEDPGEQAWRIALGDAAVEAVCAEEEANGWKVVRMAQTNEGYDIEASKGQESRFIEVKGLKGDWTEHGVGMSKSQFEYARNFGESYWLYVVERAQDPQRRRITRIQDPARKITQYRFDSSWHQLDAGVSQAVDGHAETWIGRTIQFAPASSGRIQKVQVHGKLTRLMIEAEPGGGRWIIYNPREMRILPPGDG